MVLHMCVPQWMRVHYVFRLRSTDCTLIDILDGDVEGLVAIGKRSELREASRQQGVCSASRNLELADCPCFLRLLMFGSHTWTLRRCICITPFGALSARSPALFFYIFTYLAVVITDVVLIFRVSNRLRAASCLVPYACSFVSRVVSV